MEFGDIAEQALADVTPTTGDGESTDINADDWWNTDQDGDGGRMPSWLYELSLEDRHRIAEDLAANSDGLSTDDILEAMEAADVTSSVEAGRDLSGTNDSADVPEADDAASDPLEFMASLENTLSSLEAEYEDQRRGDATLPGSNLPTLSSPPERTSGYSERLREVWLDNYNGFVKNKVEQYESDEALQEAALQEAWNALVAEKLESEPTN